MTYSKRNFNFTSLLIYNFNISFSANSIAMGIPAGYNIAELSPSVEADEWLCTHIDYPGAITLHEKQCWVLGLYDQSS